MGSLLSYALTCDWVHVEQEEGISTEGKTTPVPCRVSAIYEAGEQGLGRSQKTSVELAATKDGWLHRSGKRGKDLWFCPTHALHIEASGL